MVHLLFRFSNYFMDTWQNNHGALYSSRELRLFREFFFLSTVYVNKPNTIEQLFEKKYLKNAVQKAITNNMSSKTCENVMKNAIKRA